MAMGRRLLPPTIGLAAPVLSGRALEIARSAEARPSCAVKKRFAYRCNVRAVGLSSHFNARGGWRGELLYVGRQWIAYRFVQPVSGEARQVQVEARVWKRRQVQGERIVVPPRASSILPPSLLHLRRRSLTYISKLSLLTAAAPAAPP
jgi:hypothetical protein